MTFCTSFRTSHRPLTARKILLEQALNKYNFRFSCTDSSHRVLSPLVCSSPLPAAASEHRNRVGTHSGQRAVRRRRPRPARTRPGRPTAIDYDTIHLEKRLSAVRATGAITLDGALDEPAWSEAPIANGFIQNDPREGQPATYDTDVRVLYTDDALYFGVFAHDEEPSKIIVSDLKKDYNTGSSDGFRIVLDTFHDGRNGYQFATNPAGAKWDSQMANEGRDNNANWDGIWDVKTRITETGWFAEIWIPFRTLKFGDADPQVWGINFERKLRRLNEDSYWSPHPAHLRRAACVAGRHARRACVACTRARTSA